MATTTSTTAAGVDAPCTVTVVHCWSAPRSRSTALLYSFESRGEDCVAMDEPLYREWLINKGDSVARPYRRELIEGVAPEGKEVDLWRWQREHASLSDRLSLAVKKLKGQGGVIFCKHMAKHSFLYDFDNELAEGDANVAIQHRHVLLIRDPVAVLSSWKNASEVHGNNPTPDEVGIVPLLSIYSSLSSRTPSKSTQPVVILDSDDLIQDPPAACRSLCDDLNIPYRESMLTWKSGPHDCDGPWAAVSHSLSL